MPVAKKAPAARSIKTGAKQSFLTKRNLNAKHRKAKEDFLNALDEHRDSIYKLRSAIANLKSTSTRIVLDADDLSSFDLNMTVLQNELNRPRRWDEWTTPYGFTMMPDLKVKWMKEAHEERHSHIDENIKLSRQIKGYERMLRYPGKYKSVEEAMKVIEDAYQKSRKTRRK